MKHWIYRTILTAGGCALLAQPALAQPKVRDQRKPAQAAPAAPATRDHRAKKKLVPQPAPNARDHRNDKGKAKGPKARDHRADKGKAIGPKARDHRADTMHDGPHTTPATGPEVRDHRRPVTAPLAPDGPRNEVVPSRRGRANKRWSSYQIPIVKRYWPNKGAVGTTVTVHGANFSPELAVFIGDTAIADAAITETSISFAIPAGVAKGMLTVRGKRRPIAIGNFEVASYDAKAERKKRRAERRKQAKSKWMDRKQKLAGDREARLLALQERETALQETRTQRRSKRRAEIRANFEAAFLADEATLAELALHAERSARLARMQRLAETNDSESLVIRIDVAIAEENDRHEARLATLKATFQAQ